MAKGGKLHWASGAGEVGHRRSGWSAASNRVEDAGAGGDVEEAG